MRYLLSKISLWSPEKKETTSLNFGSNFYRLTWYYCLFFTTSMPYDAHTSNACDEMMPGWQGSVMLKLALQPVADQSPIGRRLVADYM